MVAVKKMSKSSYSTFMMAAVVADVFNFLIPIPGQGDIVILLLQITFWLNGYGWKTKTMITGLLIEAIPIVSLLPGCCMFVTKFYKNNLLETKKQSG